MGGGGVAVGGGWGAACLIGPSSHHGSHVGGANGAPHGAHGAGGTHVAGGNAHSGVVHAPHVLRVHGPPVASGSAHIHLKEGQ